MGIGGIYVCEECDWMCTRTLMGVVVALWSSDMRVSPSSVRYCCTGCLIRFYVTFVRVRLVYPTHMCVMESH